MKKKHNFFLIALIIGILSWFLIAARLDVFSSSDAEVEKHQVSGNLEAFENAFVEVIDRVKPAVVSIATERIEKYRDSFGPFGFGDDSFDELFRHFFGQPRREAPRGREKEYRIPGLGSGVIIDEEGYVLTNEHVIQDADKITVTLPDGRKFKGELKGKDARSDLAIIKIRGKNLPAVALGDSDALKVGQLTIAIGNPFGFFGSSEPAVSSGIVSALGRSLRMPDGRGGERAYNDLIQTDAAINRGNSGGPLLNIKGEIIGINVAIASTSGGSQGVGFAIPVNIAKDIIGSLIEGKRVLYGWLGINIRDIDQDLADYFGLKDIQGVFVDKVLEDTPAEKGGFKETDIIKTFNGVKVKNVRDLLKVVGRAPIGEKAKIGIVRGKKPLTLEVEVGERPEELTELGKISPTVWRGLEVQEITPELADRFNLKETEGIIIVNVEPGSPADYAGLRRGDIIYSVDRRQVKKLKNYTEAVKKAKGNTLIKTNRGYAIVKEEEEEE